MLLEVNNQCNPVDIAFVDDSRKVCLLPTCEVLSMFPNPSKGSGCRILSTLMVCYCQDIYEVRVFNENMILIFNCNVFLQKKVQHDKQVVIAQPCLRKKGPEVMNANRVLKAKESAGPGNV
jgi:hypothetical protein